MGGLGKGKSRRFFLVFFKKIEFWGSFIDFLTVFWWFFGSVLRGVAIGTAFLEYGNIEGRQVFNGEIYKKCPGLESNQHEVLTPPGPQPGASANSATRAYLFI